MLSVKAPFWQLSKTLVDQNKMDGRKPNCLRLSAPLKIRDPVFVIWTVLDNHIGNVLYTSKTWIKSSLSANPNCVRFKNITWSVLQGVCILVARAAVDAVVHAPRSDGGREFESRYEDSALLDRLLSKMFGLETLGLQNTYSELLLKF